MAKDLLLEIGLEEMPAHVVQPSIKQLEQKVIAFLEENRLTFDTVEMFSTPRRLAIKVTNLPDRQADTQVEAKGPAKRIALDQDLNWTKAAEGFVRGQGLTTDAITFRELNGTEYAYVTKYIHGKETIQILVGLADVISSLTFPVSMHWANYDLEYIRPIHWIVALLDEAIIPFQILDVKTGRQTRGHRFLGEDIILQSPDEYEEKLADQFVIASSKKREAMIRTQAESLAEKNHWLLDLDESLLEEVNNLLEYPTVFSGTFDETYLSVPEEVLVTSMKEHQRYFEVRNERGILLPHFISARNGNKAKLDNVVRGNQKVLTARLEDAAFFYNEDKKHPIDYFVEKLKHLTFHEKIGSVYEKMQRVQAIAKIIGEAVGLTAEEQADLQRAAEIYKFDLVTSMVGEFPELQGVMGEKYARMQGEKTTVALAIKEHYLPNSSEGVLPASSIGAVLAIADKLDSVLSFFASELIPSGSNDPYALRRQAYGIVRIIEDKNWTFPLSELQDSIRETINQAPERFGMKLEKDNRQVIDFVKGRLRQLMLAHKIDHDVIDAALAAEQNDLQKLLHAAQVLKDHHKDEGFKPSIEALTRAINLAKKATNEEIKINKELFENEAENKLYTAVQKIKSEIETHSLEENFKALVALRPLIENYFDQTMVMVDDEAVKNNRLAQLREIAKLSLALASLDLLITK